jgi:hypothetical protein
VQIATKTGQAAVDAKAALAALYAHDGRKELAASLWSWVCSEGEESCCYKQKKWLESKRHWPPSMVKMLGEFVELAS